MHMYIYIYIFVLPFSLGDPGLRNPRKTGQNHRNDRFGRDPENTRKKLSGDLAGRPTIPKIPAGSGALGLWTLGLWGSAALGLWGSGL